MKYAFENHYREVVHSMIYELEEILKTQRIVEFMLALTKTIVE
jgi:hypothetical protein